MIQVSRSMIFSALGCLLPRRAIHVPRPRSAGLLLALLVACNDGPTEPPGSRYTAAEIAHFGDVAFGSEQGAAEVLRRWGTPLTLRVLGRPTPADLAVLAEAAAEVERSTGVPVRMATPAEEATASVQAHFLSRAEAQQLQPELQRQHIGYFWVWWSGDVIYRARLTFVVDEISERTRPYIIRHELMHSLGFLRHAHDTGSLLYQPWRGTTAYSAADRAAMEMLYRRELRPGMQKAEALAVLQRLSRPPAAAAAGARPFHAAAPAPPGEASGQAGGS